MCLKLVKFLTNLCLITLLLVDFSFVAFCQNNSINSNKTNDDFVYDYGSGDNGNTSTTEDQTSAVPAIDAPVAKARNLNDDYVYDYGSGVKELNSTSAGNQTSHVTYDNNEGTDTTDPTESDDNAAELVTETSASDSKPGILDQDLGFDDEEEECDRDTLLTKMLNVHHTYLNITNQYKVKHVNHINETFERLEYVKNLYNKYFTTDKNFGTQLLAFVSTIEIILTPECFASFFALISGWRNNKLWANKFMDVMGRPLESGTGDGKHSSFGEFDECIDLESPEDKGLIVKGQYCLVKVVLPYPKADSYKRGDPYPEMFNEKGITPFKYFNGGNSTSLIRMIENLNIYRGSTYRLGLCVPHLCKRAEVDEFINKVLFPITHLPLEVVDYPNRDGYCIRKDKSDDYTIPQVVASLIITLLAVIMITCTGIEIYNIIYLRSVAEGNQNLGDVMFAEEEELVVNPYYYTFSLVTNTRELLSKNNRFAALDTIRLFVIIHIYIFDLYNTMATIGITTLKRTYATYPGLVLEYDRYTTLRNTLVFDILFVMSGFILSNSLLGKLERYEGRFNYFKYLANRYIRFSVPLLGSIIFFYTLPLIGSGPTWEEGYRWVTEACESPLVVLMSFLFVSNYNDQIGIMSREGTVPYCNPPTWMISALFQLHVVVPIFVYIYYRNQKRGLYTIGGAIVVGMFASIAPTLIFNILPQTQYILIESYYELFRSFTWYHLSTTQYIVSFLVGVVGGYILRMDLNLGIEHEVLGWSASVLAIITAFVWNNTFWKTQKSASLYSVLLFYTFGKCAYAAAFAWIFYAICTGRAQTLNYILSWSKLQPLARLSFSFFMVHFMIVIRRVFSVKETHTMTDGAMIEYIIIDLIVTFILAYFFYGMVEAPFTNLMSLWLNKGTTDQPADDSEPIKNGNVVNKSTPEQLKRDFGHFNEIELEEDVNKDSKDFETIRI